MNPVPEELGVQGLVFGGCCELISGIEGVGCLSISRAFLQVPFSFHFILHFPGQHPYTLSSPYEVSA